MSSPIIFEKGTRDFSTIGLGLLSDAIQATTTEELNGQFIFEMDYPVFGNNADLIKENRIIVVNSGHILKRQGFIIRQIVRKIDFTMTVYAEHVSYATLDVALAPVGTISGDAKTALENWKRMLVPAVDFTVDSDILTTNSTSIGAPEFETARQGLGGHTGSILDVWGGEYQFDNWHIRLLKQRGKSANAIIAYGRNLISFEQDTNIADTYTSVYPYYQENSGDEGNKTHFLPERTVDSEFVGKYPNPKVLMLDLSNKFKDVADYSENKLRNYALSYIQSNNIGVPKVNMKISTVDLSRAMGGFSEDIDLGDTVNVYFEKLGITTSAKVIKAVWNVLSDDYDKFEIGARRASLTESISELATTADENANKALNQALVALQSADGKSTIYYLNSSDPWPTNPKENDTAFVKDGENSIMYRYMFNNDTGVFSWVKILDSMSADQIKQRVSDALKSGKAYSDQLVADNVAQVNAVLGDVQAKQADLTAQQAELDTKAQGYADKALADAKADTLATATQTAKDASDALAKAKTDLTTSLNKEVTDRANAVTALDTKAKGYATQAKTDAIATAIGAVAKEVTDRQKAITDLDAKSTGAINQAKIDAQSALDALSTGDRNYILDTGNPKRLLGYGKDNFDYFNQAKLYKTLQSWGTTAGAPYVISFDWTLDTPLTADMNASVFFNQSPWQEQRYVIPANQKSGHATFLIKLNAGLLTQKADITSLTFRVNNQSAQGNALTISNLYMKSGNVPTDWTPAPEDIVLDYTTKDNVISQSLTQYQATNDGKVTKAQSDATQALGLVATKVSQTDYNTKTGDLDSKYTAVKQTADQASTDIVAIKSTNTSQDTKINTLTSDVSGTKQSISDIQTEQGKQSTKINTIQTDVSGTKQDISDIKDANGVQDGKIASISTTVDGLSSSFSTYKTTNDGKVAKAQADITTNSTAISQKVSQTAYDAKTGQLQTDLNTTTTTANQAKTDIVAIKSDNTKQDARMTTIESDANGTKTTVSNLQTDLGKANGSITTLQQRADGFDATVTKVNNLSVGGRNLLLHTNTNSYSTLNSGNGQYTTKYVPFDGGYKYQFTYTTASTNWAVYQFWGFVKEKYEPDTDYVLSFMANFSVPVTPSVLFANGASGNNFVQQKTTPTVPSGSDQRVVIQLHTNATIPTASDQSLYMGNFQRGGAGTFTIWDLKIEKGNLASSYTPAPEDVDSATAKAQLTADKASLDLSKYQTDADGRISKAQADIIVNANAITQKVSQSDYNAKTGDLTTKVNTAQSTADSATSTIGAYKTANDARVASAESKITANATAITSKVSQSDYNTKTGQIDGQISTINQTAGNISQTVSDVKAQVDGLSVGGRNWLLDTKTSKSAIGNNTSNQGSFYYTLASGMTSGKMYTDWGVGSPFTVSFDWVVTGSTISGEFGPQLVSQPYGIGAPRVKVSSTNTSGHYVYTSTSIASNWAGTSANSLTFRLEYLQGTVTISNIKFEQGNLPTAWGPAPEDTDNKISTVSQTVDSISSIVSDPTTGLTKRVQTAEGTLSQVTGADIPALQKATYWQGPNGYDLNTYLTQGSFFFANTNARTNNPKADNGWMYLVVEQANGGSRVTQTAWYDSVTSAKVTYKRQYTSGTWGAWYANDNDSVASIAQTNGAIQTEISNRQTGDTNTLTQAKDFTTSSISNSESGMRSLITQTSDSIIAKVDTKTNSATVLSLLKDNWSIGIADNAGAITSGIVGNSSNMSLISNNVTINSPQTQIKGTAWINSAMIANGAIGKAQIGDASIDTAKIASLDVAKLTGNVSSFIQSNWNGVFASTMIDNTGMSINGGNTTTKFDTSGAHYSNGSGISATYSFGKWSDQSGNATSSTGLYLGATGSENSFINILGTNGAAALVLAGSAMDYGANLNVMQGTLNSYVNVNIRTQLHFKGNKYNSPSYIEINESNRTFNFWTGGGSVGGGNYFYFNQNVISAGTFSSTSVLSKKNVKSVYDEDALGEIAKTQLVNFEYKNRIGQNHVSPIIDDVNSEKEYYIPKTILGQDNEYVDMYSMISMAWRAIQQLNEKIGDK